MDRHDSILKLGFTIVELLVVIVIIGILAAITVVAYGGISQKAAIASVTSDLNNASKLLKIFNINNGIYPTTISTNCSTNPNSITNECLKTTADTAYSYKVSSISNNKIFCLDATKSSISYNVTQEGQIQAGPCPVLNLDAGNTLSYSGTGIIWQDLSGNDNNGTINGGLAYDSTDGGTMSFDGVDDYVNVGNESSLKINDKSFTLSAWIKPATSIPGGSRFTVMSNFSPGWLMDLTDSSNIEGYRLYNGISDYNSYIPSNKLISLDWTQYVVVRDINSKTMMIYLNGELKQTFNTALISNSTNDTLIGKRADGYFFKGRINDTRIYNAALSTDDVLQNYNVTKSRYGL